MAKFAILTGNTVVACIVADTKAVAIAVGPKGCDAVEYTNANSAGPGYIYNPVTQTFTAPVKEEETPNA